MPPKEDNYRIHVTEGSYDIPHVIGELKSCKGTDDDVYRIESIHVHPDFRRLGIGKSLLYLAKQQAMELGAATITAAIISRECIDAARTVFGKEALIIQKEGGYHAPEGNRADVFDAQAALIFNLEV